MKTVKNIFNLLTIPFLLTISLYSCCKYQISAALEIKFENFHFSTMDSVLLIKVDRNNINQHQDTTFHNLSTNHSIYIPVFDNDTENGSFIIKNLSPTLEHSITEINAERTKSFGCAGGRIKFSFKSNGIQYQKEKEHTITIKP